VAQFDGMFQVETILSETGGKVIVRLAEYEAQLDPLDAQRFALALVEAAASARAESWLVKFLQEQLEVEIGAAARVIASFRDYRSAPAAAPGGMPFTIVSNDAREIFRITADGKVIVNPDFTLDEATSAFWRAVEKVAAAPGGKP